VPSCIGTWVPNSSQDPYGKVGGNQAKRDINAEFTHHYTALLTKLRGKAFKTADKGTPLEWVGWHRLVVDEVHEVLCPNWRKSHDDQHGTKKAAEEKGIADKKMRAATELIGVSLPDPKLRPLRARTLWGLSGTPMLDSVQRVTELAWVVGGSYVTGSYQHWRRFERASCREIFLGCVCAAAAALLPRLRPPHLCCCYFSYYSCND
jgi:hypothetical protein